jgi:hypothetical protein
MQRPLPRPVSSPTQCFFFLLPLCRQQRLSAPLSGHFTRAQKYFFLAVLAEAFSLFPVQSLPLRRAQFSFACRHALSGHVPGAQIFCLLPLSRTAGPVRAKKKNFFVWSPVWCACRIFFLHAASGHFPPAARADFLSFWLCMKTCEWRIFYLVNSRGAHADFFCCSVRSPLLCSARADFLGHFCSARALAVHACQGRPLFFPVQSLPAAARKFEFVVSGSLTTLVRTSRTGPWGRLNWS